MAENASTGICLAIPELILTIASHLVAKRDVAHLSRISKLLRVVVLPELVRDIQITVFLLPSLARLLQNSPHLSVHCYGLYIYNSERPLDYEHFLPHLGWIEQHSPREYDKSIRNGLIPVLMALQGATNLRKISWCRGLWTGLYSPDNPSVHVYYPGGPPFVWRLLESLSVHADELHTYVTGMSPVPVSFSSFVGMLSE